MWIQTRQPDTQTSTRTTINSIEGKLTELEKQESDLLAHLRCLQDTIARKRAHAESLKNSLIPIYRIPNEILLACFKEVVQDWVGENKRTDERMILDQIYSDDYKTEKSKWPCSPAFAISHVSNLWRQLAIRMPALWANPIITPSCRRHWDVLQDFLQRVECMPIAANCGSVGPRKTQSLTELSLMEAVMPLLPTHKFNALALANVGEAGPLFLLSQMTDQPKQIMSPLSPAVSSHLTALTVFKITGEERLDYTRLKFLLRATSQLKIFTFEHFGRVD